MAVSSDGGALTSQQASALVIVWSEPITGLAASQFKIMGPASASVGALKLLRGTSSYYHLLLQLPGDYTGPVSVTFTVSSSQVPLPRALLTHCADNNSQLVPGCRESETCMSAKCILPAIQA